MSSNQSEQSGAAFNPEFNPDGLTFEEAFRQLADIAEKMEAGGLTLGDATAQFEQGMKLVQRCNQLLDSAELEVTTLRENYQRPAASASPNGETKPPFFDDPPYDEDAGGDEEDLPF